MAVELTPRLAELRKRFIVPNDAIVDLITAKRRASIFDYYYCPYAPCCSDCRGVFAFRELMGHLRRVHEHGAKRIKALVTRGLPKVPERNR